MKRWAYRSLASVGVGVLGLLSGCNGFFVYPGSLNSGGTGTTGTGDYVYVANATTQNVAGFQVGSGTLTALSGSPYSLGYTPTAAVVNPSNSILFVASVSGVYSYSISSAGVLALLNGGPAATTLTDVVSLAVSPDGKWLFALDGFAVNTSSGVNALTLYQFQIDASTGALTAVTGVPTYSISGPGSPIPVPSQINVASVPSGVYIFVALGTGGTLVIPFNTSTGAQLTPTQYGQPSGSSVYLANVALAVNSSTSALYVVSSNTSSQAGAITAYGISANGTNGPLTPLAPSAATAFLPTSVVLNSAGTDVYVGNQASNSISGYSTTVSNNTLPVLTGSPYSFGYAPTGLAVDRSGSYLLAITNVGSPNLTMYSYDATTSGQLDQAASTATGTNPVAIAATH